MIPEVFSFVIIIEIAITTMHLLWTNFSWRAEHSRAKRTVYKAHQVHQVHKVLTLYEPEKLDEPDQLRNLRASRGIKSALGWLANKGEWWMPRLEKAMKDAA